MLPVANEIGLDLESSKLIAAKSSCSPISQRSDSIDGGHCSVGIRVKVVAEINKNCSTLGINAAENEKSNYFKRDSSCADENDSKRARLSEDIDDQIQKFQTEQSTRTSENKNADSLNNPDKEYVNDQGGNESVFKIKSEPLVESNEESSTVDISPSSSGATSTIDIKRAVKIEKGDASSSSRESCKFGIRCYRRNPVHRVEEAHPGDHDYKRPNYPPPPKGTPDCPYGSLCYRRNPVHFEQFNHPPETNFEQNYKNYRLRARQHQHEQTGDDLNASTNSSDSDDDYDLDDPFMTDEEFDLDYVPNSIDEDGDDDDDYDACDRVEE